MRKIITLVAAATLFLVCGCSPSVAESGEGVNTVVDASSGAIGITVGKVWVGSNEGVLDKGYYPGKQIEYGVQIVNAYSEAKQVILETYSPGGINDGFIAAPESVADWVTFEDDNPTIPANSTRSVMVSFQMPKDAEVFADQWEFRIRVTDASQQGMVKHAVGQRWLITMR